MLCANIQMIEAVILISHIAYLFIFCLFLQMAFAEAYRNDLHKRYLEINQLK
jgi:hypothetical protein